MATVLKGYQASIAEVVTDIEPRIIEAYMRTTYRTLDGLSVAQFNRAAREARDEVLADGPELAEEIARLEGL